MLGSLLQSSVAAMDEYRESLTDVARTTRHECVQASALDLNISSFKQAPTKGVDLILTSPPYPGVHVLYHRWNVRARRETPVLFWLANCLDGHGSVHYTLGDPRQEDLPDYFAGIQALSLTSVSFFPAMDSWSRWWLSRHKSGNSQPILGQWQTPVIAKFCRVRLVCRAKVVCGEQCQVVAGTQ